MEWISVDDRLPEGKQPVLIYVNNEIEKAYWQTEISIWVKDCVGIYKDKGFFVYNGGPIANVTGWAELKPPQ